MACACGSHRGFPFRRPPAGRAAGFDGRSAFLQKKRRACALLENPDGLDLVAVASAATAAAVPASSAAAARAARAARLGARLVDGQGPAAVLLA